MRARGRRCGARKFCVVFLLSSGGSESMLNYSCPHRAGHLAEVLTAESAQGLRIHLFTRARNCRRIAFARSGPPGRWRWPGLRYA